MNHSTVAAQLLQLRCLLNSPLMVGEISIRTMVYDGS
jgi:hypothetical protein